MINRLIKVSMMSKGNVEQGQEYISHRKGLFIWGNGWMIFTMEKGYILKAIIRDIKGR